MTKKADWKTLAKTAGGGFLMGIGAIAPGISGGAIAVVCGLYEDITDAVAHFYRQFREKMKLLIPLGVGVVLGVLLFGRVIEFFFNHYNLQTRCLFIGLMAGTLPSVFRTAAKKGFHIWYLLLFAAGTVLTCLLGQPGHFTYTGGVEGLTVPLLLLSGAVIGFGTIVPGVSSSFLLMAAGLYEPLLDTLNTMDVARLIPIAVGFGAFVLLFARLVSFLYAHAYGAVSFTVCGLLTGSIFPVIPPLRWDLTSGLALLLTVTGAALSWWLLRRRSGAADE
ncbi:MAG: DUF368 domain-containing protein [Clostridiales bacterium]|nr:DUF368 domain-containing protein [Clostridiales bacterium]